MIDFEKIRSHALANYDKGGWYVLAECWDNKDILEFCQRFNIEDTDKAIQVLGEGLMIYDDSELLSNVIG
jgi:hypothetical protein